MTEIAGAAPVLAGRRVVIAGGTGSVGEGIVRAWLGAGAHVVVPTRSHERLEEFRGVLGAAAETELLSLVVGDHTTPQGAADLADRIQTAHGPVSDAVASIGGWWAGPPLWQTDQAAWDEYFAGFATGHWAWAQAWVPRIGAGGTYHIIVGGSAIFPVPGSGIVSMQQAALLMMGRVLQAETTGKAGLPRVFTSLLGPVNSRNRPQQRPDWVSNHDVGLLTATVAADPEIAPASFELLDTAGFHRTLQTLTEAGARS